MLCCSMPSLAALLVYTKVPRSTKKMVAEVRQRYDKVRSFSDHNFIIHVHITPTNMYNVYINTPSNMYRLDIQMRIL